MLFVEMVMSMQVRYRCEAVLVKPKNPPASIVGAQSSRLRNYVYVQLVCLTMSGPAPADLGECSAATSIVNGDEVGSYGLIRTRRQWYLCSWTLDRKG